mgnify:CR=1 FL=1|jgi:hypothetical protein
MFKYENAVSGITRIESVWSLYADVSKWKLWDKSVKDVQITGEFEVGASGFMEMPDGTKLPFTITNCEINKSFTSESKLGPVTVVFGHLLEKKDDIVTIIHTIQISGSDEKQMEGMGRGITANIPDSMCQLLSISKNNEII